ncbi:MAG TPA: hypothetical protein VGN70_06435 [Gammaproteobacteria bacterium]|jgi:hypothetical protein
MFTYLLGLFVLVMAGGVALAIRERREPRLPLKISVLHGVLGVAAIVWLVMQAIAHPGNHPVNIAVVIFMLTTLGGLLLFAFRASKQRLPLAVVVLHALFALAGLTLLFAGWSRMQ